MSTDKKIVRIVRKSNDLVEGKYHFNMWETRVFTKMLTLISKDDADFKEYRIFLKEVVDDFELKDKNAYNWIKKGAEGLARKEIRVIRQTEEGEKEFLTHIAIGVESFTKNGNYVDISFHPKMKPYLLQLQTQFLMYDVENILQLQSFYSIRIYELLKQYEKIGKRVITVKELKDMLAIEDKYPQYGHFKSRIILKAQEDLASSTDICFDFDEIKKGRQVVALTFYIKANNQNTGKTIIVDNLLNLPVSTENNAQKLFDELRDFHGATEQTLNFWVNKYGENYVRQGIDFMKKEIRNGLTITNPMGFLQNLIKQGSFVSSLENESKIKQAERELRRQRDTEKQQEQELDLQRKDLFQRYRAAMLNQLSRIFEDEPKLGVVFMNYMKNLETKPINIELALENYKRILSVPEGDSQEILYNFEAGGSFSFALEEWLTGRYPIIKKMHDQYYSRLDLLKWVVEIQHNLVRNVLYIRKFKL